MERFIGTDTASVELFFNIITSGIETFAILCHQLSCLCVVEVCCLGLEPLCDACHMQGPLANFYCLNICDLWILRKMDHGNVNPTQHLPWWLRETTKRTPVSLVSTRIWTWNSPKLTPVWWISIGAVLCSFENFITDCTSQISRSWTKSLYLQPLQWCYCENLGNPTSSCVMWRHYSYHQG